MKTSGSSDVGVYRVVRIYIYIYMYIYIYTYISVTVILVSLQAVAVKVLGVVQVWPGSQFTVAQIHGV